MSISAAAQGHPIVTINPGLPFVTSQGFLSNNARIALQQIHNFVVSTNRTIPCNATGTDLITLTLLPSQPTVDQYISYESFAFTAENDSTAAVTARVVTATGALATLKVYKSDGVQADSGDIKADALYWFSYNDALDSGDGGFVISGGSAGTITPLSLSAVSGTGDDATINSNFTAIQTAINEIITAIGA